MPRQQNLSSENNFIGGFVTEFTGLNFPENSCTETSNCIFSITGEISRRPGFDLESSFTGYEIPTKTGRAINTYVWRNAAGSGNYNFVVVQLGHELHFYQYITGEALSDHKKSTVLDISVNKTAVISITDFKLGDCQFASGDGKLFVVHPFMEPIYVTYNVDIDTFTATPIYIRIRDFEGVDDGLSTIATPGSLSNTHEYNLRNQGWVPSTNYITQFHAQEGFYPNNASQWWIFKNADNDFSPSTLYDVISRGNSPAPRGFNILDAFNQDRSAVSSIAGLGIVSAGANRPTSVAFFAGRVFYAGVATEGFNTRIYFSQIALKPDQYGKAHQQNDPTSETLFDLLPSDGGVIVIPEIGNVIKLFPMDNNLLVFASNGIWAITGSQGIGFTANDYTVKNISSFSSIAPNSFVNAGGIPTWWSDGSIYFLQASAQGLTVESATNRKIATFFDSIPQDSKRYVKGVYNTIAKTIEWVYRSRSASNFEQRYEYDHLLVFNTLTGAFYGPWTISPGVAFISSVVSLDNNPLNKYLTVYQPVGQNLQVSWSENNSYNYLDWSSVQTGTPYTSYFITGYKLHGKAVLKFQSNYVYIYSNNLTDTAYSIQGLWNYANSGNSGKWSSVQRVYIFQDNYSNAYRRHKIRGQGIALQLKISSIDNEPFNLLGWSIFETINAHV